MMPAGLQDPEHADDVTAPVAAHLDDREEHDDADAPQQRDDEPDRLDGPGRRPHEPGDGERQDQESQDRDRGGEAVVELIGQSADVRIRGPEGQAIAVGAPRSFEERSRSIQERQQVSRDDAHQADEQDDRSQDRSAAADLDRLGPRLATPRRYRRRWHVAGGDGAQVRAAVLAEGDAGAIVCAAARAGHRAFRGAGALDRARDAGGNQPLAAVATEGEAGSILGAAARALGALADCLLAGRDGMRLRSGRRSPRPPRRRPPQRHRRGGIGLNLAGRRLVAALRRRGGPGVGVGRAGGRRFGRPWRRLRRFRRGRGGCVLARPALDLGGAHRLCRLG